MTTAPAATVKVPVLESTEREAEEALAHAATTESNDDEAAVSDAYYALPCTD